MPLDAIRDDISGVILIDQYGNKFCDRNRYHNAVICIVYDASSILDNDLTNFSHGKAPYYLPSSNGIYISVEGTYEYSWRNISNDLRLLKMNRIIGIYEWGMLG